MLNEKKRQAIKKAVEYVMTETGEDQIGAISLLQSTATVNNNEDMVADLAEYKREVSGIERLLIVH